MRWFCSWQLVFNHFDAHLIILMLIYHVNVENVRYVQLAIQLTWYKDVPKISRCAEDIKMGRRYKNIKIGGRCKDGRKMCKIRLNFSAAIALSTSFNALAATLYNTIWYNFPFSFSSRWMNMTKHASTFTIVSTFGGDLEERWSPHLSSPIGVLAIHHLPIGLC